MCGITGYVGGRPAIQTAIGSLKRLEYRGYDSAGVAYALPDCIAIRKAAGRIVNLEAALENALPPSSAAVAHTRWATHGRPSEANAHPHADCRHDLAVVHNGIIENHGELRRRLQARGHAFSSETDTEVVAHLIEEGLPDAPSVSDFVRAARGAIAALRGSYALAIVSRFLPGAVLVARRESPLVVGLGEGETFLASDIPALLGHAHRVLSLEDDDCALLRAEGVEVFGLDGLPRHREPMEIAWEAESAERAGFEHFMLKEIHEGPRTVRDTLRDRLRSDGTVTLADAGARPEEWTSPRRVTIVGCGTAYHAGLVGRRLLEQVLRRPVEAAVASEFRYGDPLVDGEALVVLVSQSGETADTIAALREARTRGSRTLAVVNVVGSTLAREADAVLYTRAGPEIGVASTKAYLAQLAAFALLTLRLAPPSPEARRLAAALADLPTHLREALTLEPEVTSLAGRLAGHRCFFYLGRGYDHAAAAEAALKMKEISYIHAEAYPAGEMKHGPLALVEPGVAVVGLCTQQATHGKMASNLREVKAREGTVVAVVRAGLAPPEGADHVLTVPEAPDALMPAVVMVPLQLLAYHVARRRGCAIDQPRNLAKSVTVE
ncbi:MAG: glutamine--fructose-6-phosphate transaminase (isomerizing) [Chthonomonadales bacterium]|nr:glutamine--fructose-6-phosphate transaminase (isomerizing) [Chthonomonadales bacterium]